MFKILFYNVSNLCIIASMVPGQRLTFRDLFDNQQQESRGQYIRPTLQEKEEYKVISALATEQKFKDRHVIVTGASGAVGAEVVKILLDNGAKVVIFGRDKDNLAYLKTFNSLKDIRLFKYIFDFTSFPLDLESKFREAMKDLNGVLHTVIVWHGYAEPGGIRSLNLKQWDKQKFILKYIYFL